MMGQYMGMDFAQNAQNLFSEKDLRCLSGMKIGNILSPVKLYPFDLQPFEEILDATLDIIKIDRPG